MRQLSFFDDFSPAAKTFFRVHDKVKVIEVKDHNEIYQYRKYYFSHVIGKTGVVLKVDGDSILVRIKDEEILFDAMELEWTVLDKFCAGKCQNDFV